MLKTEGAEGDAEMMEKNYVIMDMEWIDCYKDVLCPTQLAAMRVDGNWKQADMFSRLVKPINESCHDWSHIAYLGASKDDFLAADDFATVIRDLENWLQEDDILLWWANEAADAFVDAVKHVLGWECTRDMYMLQPFAAKKFGKRGNVYRIAHTQGIQVPTPPHVSANDVEAIRTVMAALDEISPEKWSMSCGKSNRISKTSMQYHYEPVRKLLHTADSGCILPGSFIQGFDTLKSCIKKRLKPCPVCCEKEYKREAAALTMNVISSMNANYVYRQQSLVFHDKECAHAKRIPYWDVRGSAYYKTCIKAGKRPCKVCKPVDCDEETAERLSKRVQKPRRIEPVHASMPKGTTRSLNKDEQRAWNRYVQSKKIKEAQDYSPNDQDCVTRGSAGYAFWSSRGYTNFHVAGCPKLTGLQNLRGFARYRDAVRQGLAPCRICRPTTKHDLWISVYKDGKVRENETVEQLDVLCKAHGYVYKHCEPYYYISTPAGKWRILTNVRPVVLWHINLIKCRGSKEEYHRQPKLLFSLADTFHYIHDHDRALLKGNKTAHIAVSTKNEELMMCTVQVE